jgi:hypothetical protein
MWMSGGYIKSFESVTWRGEVHDDATISFFGLLMVAYL